MTIGIDQRLNKRIRSFSTTERSRIDKTVELFRNKEFSLNEIYLKKLSKRIWELRPGNVRLLFGVVEQEAIIVNIFVKKTTKTPMREIKLAERRLTDYI